MNLFVLNVGLHSNTYRSNIRVTDVLEIRKFQGSYDGSTMILVKSQ